MSNDIFKDIADLINKNEINKAQIELSKLHKNYQNNSEYLMAFFNPREHTTHSNLPVTR